VVDFLSFSRGLGLHFGCKFKALKVDLRVWNKQVFGNVYNHTLFDEFPILDGLEEERALFV
jgi:hypothetical protein